MAAKPWLAHYDNDVRPSLQPYPQSTLLDYLEALARDHGSRTALLFKGATVSYGQLESESTAFAAGLWDLGVRQGDRVALLLPNCPQFFVAELGAWKTGSIVVAVNPTYSEREIEHTIESTRSDTVVVLTPFYERVKRLQGRAGIKRIIATSIKEYLPPILRVLFTLFKEKKEGHRVSLQSGDWWFPDVLRGHAHSIRPAVQVGPDDLAVILSSGGTTGTPKGVVGLHRHYVAAGLQLYEWTKSAKKQWDVIMLPLPLFHVYGNVGVQAMAFVGPNPLSLVPNPRDISDLLKTIRKVQPAFLNGVPTMYAAILNHPLVKAGKIDLRSIKLCICGAAALMAETRRRFEEQTGAVMLEGYSLTEAMMAGCGTPVRGASKIGSIGMPLPDIEARIVDAEDGSRDLPTGEVGELLMRAPQLMLEYWNNPLETSEALRTYGEGGPWLHTGDLAYLDSEGYIFLVDRKKDMVKTSGYQVWPREIEEVISAHPAVQEVGVAGIPDETKGEVAKAWVVLRAGHNATGEDLRAYCRERLAPYKVPARVEFRNELPKSLVGKVLRRVLAAEAAAGSGAE